MAIQLHGGTTSDVVNDVDVPVDSPVAASTAPRKRQIVLAVTTVAGLAGAVLIVGTSPWGRLAPPGWRLNVPGLMTAGNSEYAAITFVLGLLLMAIGWLGLVSYTNRGGGRASTQLKIVIAITVLWSVPFLLGPIQLSTDAYSYAAQGDLAALGFDPSAVGPSALPNQSANKFWRASDSMWRNSPAPYGPVAVAAEKFIVTVTGFEPANAVWGMRGFAVIGLVMSGVGVYLIARSKRVSPSMALALALANPVVIVHLVGGAHNDAVMMGLLLLGMAAFERGRKVLAVVVVSLAIAVKLPAVLALAFIAWNWKGKDAEWKQRLLSFPLVGAIAAGVIGALCLAVGIGLGWLTALSSTGMVYSTFSVFTKLGFLSADLLHAVGVSVDPLTAVAVARAIGLLTAGVLIVLIMLRSQRIGVSKALGLSLLVLMICGPVIWPWYLPAGFALLAAAGMRKYLPSMIVLIIASSVFVFPTSVNSIDGLSKYQHWLGFGVVLLIGGVCVAAQYFAAYLRDRSGRLTYEGHTIDQVLVGPAAIEALEHEGAAPIDLVEARPVPAASSVPAAESAPA